MKLSAGYLHHNSMKLAPKSTNITTPPPAPTQTRNPRVTRFSFILRIQGRPPLPPHTRTSIDLKFLQFFWKNFAKSCVGTSSCRTLKVKAEDPGSVLGLIKFGEKSVIKVIKPHAWTPKECTNRKTGNFYCMFAGCAVKDSSF